MARRRIAAFGLTLVALAFPAGALAQSAGDNQYVDPLAGQHPQTTQHSTPHSNASPSTGTPSSGSSGSGSASSMPSSSASTAAAPTTQPAQQAVPLAHTGFDAWIPALAGVLLIGAAVLLRRSTREKRA